MARASTFLNVRDLDRSLSFYQGLGFSVTHTSHDKETKAATYADLTLDGADLSLGHIAANPDPDFQNWVAGELGTGVVLYFEVDDVDAIHARAQAIDAVVESGPVDRPYGRFLLLNDPDGYSVAFLKSP